MSYIFSQKYEGLEKLQNSNDKYCTKEKPFYCTIWKSADVIFGDFDQIIGTRILEHDDILY